MDNKPSGHTSPRLQIRPAIYTQIMNQIQQQVSGGTLKPGDQLPTVRAWPRSCAVNFNTVAPRLPSAG